MKSKNSKLILGLVVAVIAIGTEVLGQDNNQSNKESYKERSFQVSFVPMFGTSRGPEEGYTNKFSLNVIGGYEHSLKGAEFGGIFNMNKYNVTGGQFSGMVNTVGGSFQGGQFAGFVNAVGGNITGGQFAGFVNVSKGYLNGGQYAGFTNIITEDVQGAQGAGFVNVTSGRVRGAQIAGFTNVADSVNGAQVAGFINVAPKGIDGAQVTGFANISQDVEGAQIAGFFNRARSLRGAQVGLINVVDSLEKGATVGLINIVGNGIKQASVEYNDVFDVNLAFRSGTTKFYSILFAGMEAKDEFLWTYGAGFGTQYRIKGRLFGNVELTTQSIHNSEDDDFEFEDDLNLLSKLNVNFGLQLANHLALTAGPSLNVYVTNRQDPTSEGYGYDIGQNIFFDEVYSDTAVKMWVGYNVSLKF